MDLAAQTQQPGLAAKTKDGSKADGNKASKREQMKAADKQAVGSLLNMLSNKKWSNLLTSTTWSIKVVM